MVSWATHPVSVSHRWLVDNASEDIGDDQRYGNGRRKGEGNCRADSPV